MKTFLTVGTSTISEELFLPIQNSRNEHQIKPSGGLWLTSYNSNYPNYNEWIDFLINHQHLLYFKNDSTNPLKKEASLVVLNNNAKIYQLNSLKDLETLQSLFPHPFCIFSYEDLSNLYDGIYINNLSLNYELFKKEIYTFSFNTFGTRTLLLFNLNSIDYYQEAIVDIDPEYINDHENTNYRIIINPEKKVITEPKDNTYLTQVYQDLKAYLTSQDIDYLSTNYWEMTKIIYEFLKVNQKEEKTLCRMLTKKLYSEMP